MNGADLTVKALEANGVKVVFGYPGASNAPFIDSVSKSSIEYVLSRNEQGAGHMASGYGRVNHVAGVCTATSGPGATNLITSIATAYMDSIPMIAITGQVKRELIGKDAFQEVDITGATLPFTKHSYLVTEAEDIPRIVNEAFHIATTGRPGPVLIDIPVDVFTSEIEEESDEEINLRGYKLVGKANEAQIKKVAAAIKKAKRPIILAGGGVCSSNAVEELRSFVGMTGIPTVSTMMGLGVIPTDSDSYFGMIGSHGRKCANILLNKSDLVIAMGTRLGDRSVANIEGLEKVKKLVHIDIDPAEIGKNTQPLIPVVGDIKDVISQLMGGVLEGYSASEAWLDEAEELRKSTESVINSEDNGFVNPRYFLRRLSEITNSDVYLSTEVGQNQIWSANNFTVKEPSHFLTSGGFGTMGYGLPAAIGAARAQSDKPVIAVMGDGSFQMDLAELGTMKQYNIPVKMVLFQNDRLGMVHELQHLHYNANYQMVDITGGPDFAKLVGAYGIKSGVVSENSDVDGAINAMLADKESYLLIVCVSPFEPTGDAYNEKRMDKEGE